LNCSSSEAKFPVTNSISDFASEAESNMETDCVPSFHEAEAIRAKESLGETEWIATLEMVSSLQAQIPSDCQLDSDAYKVFDRMPIRSHMVQSRKRSSLSPKSWMFKFKNRPLPKNK
ncbi:unnamed protein product, partial [Arabidopsis halleri]